MENIIISCFGGVGGTLIVLCFKWIIDRRRTHTSFNLKLHEQYDKAAQEIITQINDFLSLGFLEKRYTEERIAECRKQISALYFKNYNYLPLDVLLALNCFKLSLDCGGVFMYVSEKCTKSEYDLNIKYDVPRTLFKKYYKRFRRIDYVNIKRCESINDILNSDFRKMLVISNKYEKLLQVLERCNLRKLHCAIKLNIQARYLVYTIHKYYTRPYSHNWDYYLGKRNKLTGK